MNNTLSKLNGISVCVGFLISLEMKKEERRQAKQEVKELNLQKMAANVRNQKKRKKRKPCTFLLYSKPIP